MNKTISRRLVPALIGLSALLAYILACTSFSPDDSKVLYVSVDSKSGRSAVAVYDRKTTTSETLFVPIVPDEPPITGNAAIIMRPQWLNDGHDVLTEWMEGDGSNQLLHLEIQPFDHRGTTRQFITPCPDKDAPAYYYWPLPIVGTTIFLNGESNILKRVNLETGELRIQTNTTRVMVLPSPDDKHLFYLSGMDNNNRGPDELGVFDPVSMAYTPMFRIPDSNAAPQSIALSRDGSRLAYQTDDKNPQVLRVLQSGGQVRTLSLASLGDGTEIMIRHFSPGGDVLYGTFKKSSGTTNNLTSCGVIEIPIDGSVIRTTTLIPPTEMGDDLFPSFQVDLSHDGTTLAVESVWFAFGDKAIKADDCALFMVDLTDPQRKVTKVPIPLPPKDRPSPFK